MCLVAVVSTGVQTVWCGGVKGLQWLCNMEYSMQHHAPQYSTHVGCTHNATIGIAHTPSIVPAPMGDNLYTWLEILLIILLGLDN